MTTPPKGPSRWGDGGFDPDRYGEPPLPAVPAGPAARGSTAATISRRRRADTDTDALAIRDRKMLELRVLDGFDDASIAKVFGLGERSVRDGIRRARAMIG